MKKRLYVPTFFKHDGCLWCLARHSGNMFEILCIQLDMHINKQITKILDKLLQKTETMDTKRKYKLSTKRMKTRGIIYV